MSDERGPVTFATADGSVLRELREGLKMVIVHPFTPDEEWLTAEEFAARLPEDVPAAPQFTVTKIAYETRTVTLDPGASVTATVTPPDANGR